MATMASGSRMPRSSVNFSRGRILPRATPVRSGTRHSISVTRCSLSHCSRSAKLVSSLFFNMTVFRKFGRMARARRAPGLLATPSSRMGPAPTFAVAPAGLAERVQHLHGYRVVGRLPFRMPLHAEVEAPGLGHGERLDDAVGRAGLHPQAGREPVDGLAVHRVDLEAGAA